MNNVILTINMDTFHHKNFLTVDINVLKIYPWLEMTLSKPITQIVILVLY